MSLEAHPFSFFGRAILLALSGLRAITGLGRSLDRWAAKQLPGPDNAWVEWSDDQNA